MNIQNEPLDEFFQQVWNYFNRFVSDEIRDRAYNEILNPAFDRVYLNIANQVLYIIRNK